MTFSIFLFINTFIAKLYECRLEGNTEERIKKNILKR